MRHSTSKPTKAEKLRIEAALQTGCCVCRVRKIDGLDTPRSGRIEYDHLIQGNRRMGHLYGIALCAFHHRGVVPYPLTSKEEARARYGASVSDGSKAFLASHGVTRLELWQMTQGLLGLPADPPKSKVFKREALT